MKYLNSGIFVLLHTKWHVAKVKVCQEPRMLKTMIINVMKILKIPSEAAFDGSKSSDLYIILKPIKILQLC